MGKNSNIVGKLGIPIREHYFIKRFDHHIIRVNFY